MKSFNKRLGGARYHVENAFGILKARFQIFNRPLASGSEDLPFTVKLICAIFVLHNFLIDVQDESTEVDLNSIDDEGELGFGDLEFFSFFFLYLPIFLPLAFKNVDDVTL